MKRNLLDILCCPQCRVQLEPIAENNCDAEIETGKLRCQKCSREYPIVNNVPRFVPTDNYSSSFGKQWNLYRQSQLDSHSGHQISRDRFFSFTGWNPAELKGKLVLDVGCGAGRFAEIALSCGARVVAVDYSSAADACWENHRKSADFDAIQGDIYRLPFKPGSFDYVYCLGVLQHTPDVRRAFLALPEQLRENGRLAVDVYPKLWRNIFWSKYWLRPATKRMNHDRLLKLVHFLVNTFLPVSLAVSRIPVLGQKIKYLLPIANYGGVYPLTPEQIKEWALLDTFDMLAPAHDHPQTADTLSSWFAEARLENVEVFRKGFFVGRGSKPSGALKQV
jgi:SAM-dependent methyltransferase